MDPKCFDDLTRVLAAPSRRKLLATVGVTVLSAFLGLGADETTAKKKCSCKGKNCGCKGKCGTCGQNESCNKGQCVPDGGCSANCSGKAACADDGCGQPCETCAGVGETCGGGGTPGLCGGGSCTPTCQSQSRVCGDNGCGGSCGNCSRHGIGGVCNSNGHCTCAEGYRGCNAPDGGFECADILTDPKHCGSCDGCLHSTMVCCNGQCTDPLHNPSHCGGCDRACEQPNPTCCDGVCVEGQVC
jgi:hypothetical protein